MTKKVKQNIVKVFIHWLHRHWIKAFTPKLVHCGRKSILGWSIKIGPGEVSIGYKSFVGSDSWLQSNTKIGNFVMLSGRVAIVGGDHRYKVVGVPMIETGRDVNRPVTICDDVWIGNGVTILHGVTIGEGAIVGAGAVVTNDVAPYSIVAGVPAKLLKMRFSPEEIEKHKAALEKRRQEIGI